MDTRPMDTRPMDGSAPAGSLQGGASHGAALDAHAAANLASWDERAPAHAASPDYHVDDFVADPGYISDVVRFDLPRLGDVGGLRGVHLQCHVGTDTISLARLGARMTGLDFSPVAIDQARALAERCGTPAQFVVSDVYAAADVLDRGAFDLVFTGIGALCWIPDIRRWAGVVSDLLAPGGRLFLREGHPMLWALADPDDSGTLRVEHPYFELPEPTRWDEGGTYVQTDVEFRHNVSYEWNHGLGEIVTALLDQGMLITGLVEHDSIPWDGLPGLMEPIGGGELRLIDRPERLPASYTLQATKPR
jgi:SAM-dependent methyltransferase